MAPFKALRSFQSFIRHMPQNRMQSGSQSLNASAYATWIAEQLINDFNVFPADLWLYSSSSILPKASAQIQPNWNHKATTRAGPCSPAAQKPRCSSSVAASLKQCAHLFGRRALPRGDIDHLVLLRMKCLSVRRGICRLASSRRTTIQLLLLVAMRDLFWQVCQSIHDDSLSHIWNARVESLWFLQCPRKFIPRDFV